VQQSVSFCLALWCTVDEALTVDDVGDLPKKVHAFKTASFGSGDGLGEAVACESSEFIGVNETT
jgi:hypothetical protein